MAIASIAFCMFTRGYVFPKLPWFSERSNPQSIRECQLIQWPCQVPKLELPGAIVPTSNYTMWVWLVVFRPTPLKNDGVSWDDEILNIWKNEKCSKQPTSMTMRVYMAISWYSP